MRASSGSSIPLWTALALLALGSACGNASNPEPKLVTVALDEPGAARAASEDEGGDLGPVPVTRADPSIGPEDALVTLVAFAELRNPLCSITAPVIAELRQRYPGALRVVWKNAPLEVHKGSHRASEVAMGVFEVGGAQAFWAFHDSAMASEEPFGQATLMAWAASAGVSIEALEAALETRKPREKVKADLALAGALDVGGPPFYLVNGVRARSLSLESLAELVEEELAKAKGALRLGIERRRLYVAMARANLTPEARREREAAQALDERSQTALPDPSPAARPMFGAKHLVVMYQGSRRAAPSVTRTRDEAKARALEALRKARAGVKFEDVVTMYSDEPGAAARGGDLGRFPKGLMVPEFQVAVEALKPGELSSVVETPFGFHVILRTQ
jgi:protein-disulfide isomerase